jgi:hypothetical protein
MLLALLQRADDRAHSPVFFRPTFMPLPALLTSALWQIRHGVRGQQVAKQGVNTGPNALSGKLVSPSNPTQAIMSWPNEDSPYPGQSSEERIGDIIPLSTILDAVGVDLDAVCVVPPSLVHIEPHDDSNPNPNPNPNQTPHEPSLGWRHYSTILSRTCFD